MTWATHPSPTMPWEVDDTFTDFAWNPDHLNHQEFWVWLASTYGTLAAMRAFERYANDGELSLSAIVAGCGSAGETVAVWMAATQADDEYRATAQHYEIQRAIAAISQRWLAAHRQILLHRVGLLRLKQPGVDIGPLVAKCNEATAHLDDIERQINELTEPKEGR